MVLFIIISQKQGMQIIADAKDLRYQCLCNAGLARFLQWPWRPPPPSHQGNWSRPPVCPLPGGTEIEMQYVISKLPVRRHLFTNADKLCCDVLLPKHKENVY